MENFLFKVEAGTGVKIFGKTIVSRDTYCQNLKLTVTNWNNTPLGPWASGFNEGIYIRESYTTPVVTAFGQTWGGNASYRWIQHINGVKGVRAIVMSDGFQNRNADEMFIRNNDGNIIGTRPASPGLFWEVIPDYITYTDDGFFRKEATSLLGCPLETTNLFNLSSPNYRVIVSAA